MTTTIVYETDTGIVLACGNVVVDYSEIGRAHV